MTGLTTEGFEPETLESITARIEAKLETFSPGFDFGIESPDGQLISIFATEMAQAWAELDAVYHSYDPDRATGQALRNLGQITGIPYGVANASSAFIDLTGTAGTVVPIQSVVTDAAGNEFLTTIEAVIPSGVLVVALQDGAIPITAGTITTISTAVTGWTGVNQPADGTIGRVAQTESEYRNLRTRTVMRNYESTEDTMQGQLLELGIAQAKVLNNDTGAPLADGTPDQHIHVTVGEVTGITDVQIATTILKTKGLAVPTFGSTTQAIVDGQGLSHDVKFTKATAVPIFVDMNITFLDSDTAGAVESIKNAVADAINLLLAGDDVIWSRLFAYITPFARAQVNTLTIGKTLPGLAAANIVLTDTEYATCDIADINVVVV
jgi:uncharacterized phage protein gp47/JayE